MLSKLKEARKPYNWNIVRDLSDIREFNALYFYYIPRTIFPEYLIII